MGGFVACVLQECFRLSPVRALVTLAMLACGLVGCAQVTQPAADPGAAMGSATAARYFVLKGRISVRVAQQLESGQISWTRLPGEERLGLFTPLGSQVAEIVSDRSGVVMRRGEETVTAQSIGELTGDLLGVPLDLNVIAAWSQGVGLVDGETRVMQMADGEQWQVTAERFQQRGGYLYAVRVSASRGDTVVKLVVDEWQAR